MATCNFCKRSFSSSQGVIAHLRHCPVYKTRHSSASPPHSRTVSNQERHIQRLLGSVSSQPARYTSPGRLEQRAASPPLDRPILRTPREPIGEIFRQEQRAQEDLQRRTQDDRQQRETRTRAMLQHIKLLVVDLHIPMPPVPTGAMAEAKMAIEREMIKLPLLELPVTSCNRSGQVSGTKSTQHIELHCLQPLHHHRCLSDRRRVTVNRRSLQCPFTRSYLGSTFVRDAKKSSNWTGSKSGTQSARIVE